jgi:hypothetical protein
MTLKPAEYPLTWPEGHGRAASRIPSRFKTSLAGAMKNVRDSLIGFERDSKLKVTGIVISTNATISTHRPADPGVAVWFQWDGAYRCFAVDLYRTVAENLQAIHHVIEADRIKIRHAGIVFFRATFKPTAEVPMIAGPKVTGWRQVLEINNVDGLTITRHDITTAWRKQMKHTVATDEARHRELNAARDAALKEITE